MTAPLIGITTHQAVVEDGPTKAPHHVTHAAYVRAVRKAGGIPVLLPLVEPGDARTLLDRIDGVLVTGGMDVDPAAYGAERSAETGATDPRRDELDVALCRLVVQREIPALAVCRGSQVLNVALGGTLVQHVELHSDMDRYNEDVHRVRVESGSALADWLGRTELGVNSLHHQVVGTVAPDLRVVARGPNDIIEGVEVEGSRLIVGVQWHPELLRHRPEHLALFESLVKLATP